MSRSWRDLWVRVAASDREELLDRARQEVCKRVDLARYHFGLGFNDTVSREIPRHRPHFFFQSEQLPEFIALLRQRLPHTAGQIVKRAERICAHQFDLLGYTDLDYGPEIDWHCDKVHGKRAPRKPWFKIRYLDFNEVGDAKVTWELNRHQHLVTLAKAYRISGDQRFAEELFAQWYGWRAQNPYPFGVNWASSLEVGFRSLSWLWVRFLLEGSEAAPAGFAQDLSQALATSAAHIERYLSTYFSPNTHLLGEGVALFFIGTLCRELKYAKRWQQRGWQIVLREAEHQVQADGMHFEQSTYYHVYALDFLLHAGLLAARNEIPVPISLDRTIEKMAEALSVLGQAGVAARFGDDDGGRVFDPQRNRVEHLLDPLATAAVVFGRGDFKSMAGILREESLWLLGAEGATQFDQLIAAPFSRGSTALPASGFYVMTSSDPVPQQLIIDAGPQGACKAGHGHADALSLQLVANRRALLIDPGTCEYVGDRPERNLFRGTAAHNTLRIDRVDQADAEGPFSWANLVHGRAERWISAEKFDLFVGSHGGYQRLPGAPVHQRYVFHCKSRFWLVRDRVEGTGKHHLDLSWHVAPDLVRHAGPAPVFMNAERSLGLGLVWLQDRSWAQVVARESWSPVYGVKKPAVALHVEREVTLPADFVTLLIPMFAMRSDLGVLARLNKDKSDAAGLAVYRYTIGNDEHRFFFSEGKAWDFEGWASDSEFLYSQADESGVNEIVLCHASYVEYRGQRVVSSPRKIESCELVRAGATGKVLSPNDDSVTLHHWPEGLAQSGATLIETAPNLGGASN